MSDDKSRDKYSGSKTGSDGDLLPEEGCCHQGLGEDEIVVSQRLRFLSGRES